MIEFSFPRETIKNSQSWLPRLCQTHREGRRELTFFVCEYVEWETLTWLLPCLYQTILRTEMHLSAPGDKSNLKGLTASCLGGQFRYLLQKRRAGSFACDTQMWVIRFTFSFNLLAPSGFPGLASLSSACCENIPVYQPRLQWGTAGADMEF